MSFLKNILGAFVEFKEEEKTEPVKEVKAQTPQKNQAESVPISSAGNTNAASTSPISASTSATSSSTGSADPSEYKKHFENLIEEANAKNPLFAGTDFKEFIESKTDVEAISDEETKYKTAFNVLKRTGLTKEKLLSTGQEYINIIDNDIKAFDNAFAQKYKVDVEQKEQLVQQKAQELQVLNQKISALDQEMKQMSQEVIQGKEKLNSNKNLFISAGEGKKKEIETELQKIKQYFSV
ncbi:MAG: hypothetical protein WKF91_09230 [Segetibacter sp.]